MPIQKLKEFLDSHDIKYVVMSHLVAYTAQGVTHISGKELAKTVIVNIDKALATALVPASLHIDLSQLRSAASAENVAVASEEEFKERSLDCETGGMLPFGNLYDMLVFAGERLARDKEIAFNAGSPRELVRLAWEDFVRLVETQGGQVRHRQHPFHRGIEPGEVRPS
jgi:Ala-tRNA(Pro) deacylase